MKVKRFLKLRKKFIIKLRNFLKEIFKNKKIDFMVYFLQYFMLFC